MILAGLAPPQGMGLTNPCASTISWFATLLIVPNCQAEHSEPVSNPKGGLQLPRG